LHPREGESILANSVVKETAMCYLIREQRAGAVQGGDTVVPHNLDRMRPRWAGAVAAALIGGLAVAAIVAPPSASPLLSAKDSAAPAPIAASAVAVPTEAAFRQSSTPVDDGVPTAPDTVKAGMGHCDHAL
jgi:hypothetical protein